MFVVSMKTSKKKLLSYIFLSLIFIIGICTMITRCGMKSNASANAGTVLLAQTNEQRIAYLKGFGWEVSQEAIEIRQVMIPQNFSDVYLKYNKIQKEQGFDLSEYKGKLCNQYSYEVTNHPTGEKIVMAHLLVYEGEIIGGDISSPTLDGFMHGFKPEGQG